VVDFKLLKVFLLSAGFPDFIILGSINGLFTKQIYKKTSRPQSRFLEASLFLGS
jgi:hypothetical protein